MSELATLARTSRRRLRIGTQSIATVSEGGTEVDLTSSDVLEDLRKRTGRWVIIQHGSGGGGKGGKFVAGGIAHKTNGFTTASNSWVDVPDLEITVTGDGENHMWLEVSGGNWNASTSNSLSYMLIYDETDTAFLHGGSINSSGSNNTLEPVSLRYRMAPFTGTKTFKVRVRSVTSTTMQLNSNGTGPHNMYFTATWEEEAA